MRAFGLYDTEVEREERTIMAQEGQEDGGAAAAVAVARERVAIARSMWASVEPRRTVMTDGVCLESKAGLGGAALAG